MENTTAKKIKYIVLAVAILVVIWVGFTIRNILVFHITSTNPTISNIGYVSPFLDIDFNKDLSKKVLVTSSSQAVESYKVAGKELSIKFNIPLNLNTRYEIEVSNIYAASGQYMKPQYFYFTPKKIASNSLPADQRQALLNQQVNYNKNIQANSLISLLPFVGPNFEYEVNYTIDYSASGDTTVIEVTAPTAQAQQDALTWIKAQGYNPAKLKITYITAQP